MTIIRHPIERIISDYHLCKRSPKHHMHRIANSVSLVDFVKIHRMPNSMARQMIGSKRDGFHRGKLSLELVQSALDRFVFIGLYDHYIYSVQKIFENIGISFDYLKNLKFEPTDTKKKMEKLDTAEREELNTLHQFDFHIYESIKGGFK